MTKQVKKFRCMNCGGTFEVPSSAADPIRCPFCGAGPGVLVQIMDEKTPKVPMQTTLPATPTPPQPVPAPAQPQTGAPGFMKRFICYSCNKIIEVPYGVPKPAQCPYCGAPHYMIHRLDKGWARGGRGRGGGGWRGPGGFY